MAAAEEPDGPGAQLQALLRQDEATRVRQGKRPPRSLDSSPRPCFRPRAPRGARPHPPQALDEAAARLGSAAAGATAATALPPLPPERLAAARAAYGALQRAATRAVADLAALQARVAQLVGKLGALAAQRTAAEHGFSDPVQLLDKWVLRGGRGKRSPDLAWKAGEARRNHRPP